MDAKVAGGDALRGSIGELIEAHAVGRPDAIAIAAPGRPPLTFRGLLDQVLSIGGSLASLGIRSDDVVATVLPDGPEMATAFLGIAAYAAAAPLNPTYREAEFEFFLGDLKPKAIVVQASATAAIDVARRKGVHVLELPPTDATAPAGAFSLGATAAEPARFAAGNDVALILHTSGTTARPKIVPLTHANLCASAHAIATSLRLSVDDRCLVVMPLFHIHGLVGALLSSLAAGASVACAPGFQAPRFLEWLGELRPTWYTAVPSMHQGILARAAGWSPSSAPLRFIRSCSSPLAPSVMAALERTFGVPVVEAYGMTEAAHQIASNPLPPRERKPGSVGVPTGVEIAVTGPDGAALPAGVRGEVVIRGAQVTLGYRANDDADAQAFRGGWFRTGDQGFIDDDGYLFLTGRLKEIINRAGEKIAPREIDEALLAHPAVQQALAFSMPDPQVGEEVAAAVVLRPGSGATERDLQESLSARLASFKVPRRIVFVDKIPKGPTGKAQRVGLAEKLGLSPSGLPAPQPFVPPRTDLEARLARLWTSVLGREVRVGANDSFFEVGGDSILAAQLLARIRTELGAALTFVDVFRGPTLAQLASAVEQARAAGTAAPERRIERATHEGGVPLTFAQQRLWYLEQLYPRLPAYRPVTGVRFRGPLQVAALEHALTAIVERHDALRARFEERGGVPIQVILPPAALTLPLTDLQSLAPERREQEAERIGRDEAWLPFDLGRGPMFRVQLLRLGVEDHLLLVTIHHVAFDAWSRAILLRELAAAYNAACRGTAAPFEPLPISFADFAAWQHRGIDERQVEADEAFWQDHLGASPPVLELPLDRARPPMQTFRGGRVRFEVPRALRDRVTALAHRENATLAMVLMAAFQALLHRYTQRDSIVVGLPIAGRTRGETHGMIGLFVNELLLRVEVSGEAPFATVLDRTRRAMIDAYGHQDLPFDRLVRMLRPARDLGRSPLFQIAFNHHDTPGHELEFDGLQWSEFRYEPGIAAFELTFDFDETPDALFLDVDYSTDVFERRRMERMGQHYLRLLEAATGDPDTPVARLPLLSGEELAEQRRWSSTAVPYPRDATVDALFEAEVARHPDAVAIESPGGTLTYAELGRAARQVARELRARGVVPGDRVALYLEQGPPLIVGMLAVLEARAAYVPLDHAAPPDWLRHVIEDAGVRVVLVDAEATERITALDGLTVERVTVDTAVAGEPDTAELDGGSSAGARSQGSPTDLAYVMWTSGSTGRPKGVAVPHRAIVRLVRNADYVAVASTDRVAQVSHPAFDALTFEVWGALLNGATLVMVPKDVLLAPERTATLLRAQRIDVMFLTTSLFHHVAAADPAAFGCVRDLLTGGEVLDPGRARAVLRSATPPARLLNVYGPTENTTFSTWYEIREVAEDTTSIPIGRPIANSTCHVLDPTRQPVPVGVEGELYVGGDGVAAGYWNRPELTAAAFGPDPFAREPGARLYRTGDLARWLPDGTLQFVGRKDGQVKLRGFRIEVREIEFALRQHAAVHDAAVLLRASGPEKSLVAYVKPGGGATAAIGDLRAHLASRLPAYMIPARWVISDDLPLTPSGKLDRRALDQLALDPIRDTTPPAGAVPLPGRTPRERRLIDLWRTLLEVDAIGPHDDFFELGGHSMLAVRLVAEIEKEFGRRLPIAALLKASTVERMAALIGSPEDPASSAPTDPLSRHGGALVPYNAAGSRPPVFCVGPYSGTPLAFRELAAALGPEQPVYELQPAKLGGGRRDSIEATATELLEALRTVQPRGPYRLVGYCLGGSIAYELGCRITSCGEEVPLLALLDAVNYGATSSRSGATRRAGAAHWGRTARSYVSRVLASEAPLSVLRTTIERKARSLFLRASYELFRVLGRAQPARVRDGLTLDLLVATQHRPRRYPGRLILFRSADERLRGEIPSDLHWAGLAEGGIEVVQTPGDHVSILHAPDVRSIASKLRTLLDATTLDREPRRIPG